jgi:glutaredoxin
LPRNRIQALIVFDSTAKSCEAACGLNWRDANNLSILKKRLKERLGDGVAVALLDVSEENDRERQIKSKIVLENLTLPVLFVDGTVRISGEFDMRQVLDAVEAALELSD